MGQAKQRGSFDERKAAALKKPKNKNDQRRRHPPLFHALFTGMLSSFGKKIQ
jgi:hypothetical protein